MTCPERRAMNSKFLGFADSGNLRIVQFKCQECGCVYSVKTKAEIKVIKRGRLDKGARYQSTKKITAMLSTIADKRASSNLLPLHVPTYLHMAFPVSFIVLKQEVGFVGKVPKLRKNSG